MTTPPTCWNIAFLPFGISLFDATIRYLPNVKINLPALVWRRFFTINVSLWTPIGAAPITPSSHPFNLVDLTNQIVLLIFLFHIQHAVFFGRKKLLPRQKKTKNKKWVLIPYSHLLPFLFIFFTEIFLVHYQCF